MHMVRSFADANKDILFLKQTDAANNTSSYH